VSNEPPGNEPPGNEPPGNEPPGNEPPGNGPLGDGDGGTPLGFHTQGPSGAPATGDTEPAGGSRHRLVATVAVGAVVVLAAIGLFAVTRPDPPPPTTTTTTTEATTTTETTISQDVVVAAARQPTIQVTSTPPVSWASEPSAIRYGPPPPPSSAEAIAAAGDAPVPLPNDDYPIDGRRTTPVGWIFANPTSLDNPFVMMVTERRGDHLQVQVPVRPNGTVGYVRADEVDLTTISQRLELSLSERRLRFYDADVVVADTEVVIGKDATRTPTGRFYVTDQVPQDNPSGSFGPLALATSAYSEQMDEFDGGAPVIAFHGTNQPELIGSQASNGCVRMPNDVVTLIGDRLRIGARVDITA